MRESDFQAQVVDLAKMLGWNVTWTKYSLHSPKGWPDLFMVRGKRVVAAELKVNAELTGDQRVWLASLAASDKIEVFCWKPNCWPQIEKVLR
jgi:hypothetical protein